MAPRSGALEEMVEVIDVTVKVPEERVAEFYGVVGRWLAGELFDQSSNVPAVTEDDTPLPASEWADCDEDLALARGVWGKLSPRAVALFSTLMARPGQRMSGEELAALLEIPNGKYGVAGVLAWPGRFCAAVNRSLPYRYEDGPAGGSASYWMDEDVAKLFSRARDEA